MERLSTKEKIYALLKKRPMAQHEIVKELDLAASNVNHYVQLLEAEGKIAIVRMIGKREKVYGLKAQS